MALNDFVLIDGIIDDRMDNEGKDKSDPKLRGEVFERLAISELLKPYDLTSEQLDNGLVDGGDDGGIDGLYVFVNGNYISDKAEYQLPRENGKLEIYIITCKHDNTYIMHPLESLDSSLSELLNFSISEEELARKHNQKILNKRKLLLNVYKKLASQDICPIINLFYISRGDASNVPNNIQRAGGKVKTTCDSIFQGARTTMTFWGTEQLITRIREKRNAPIDINIQRWFQQGKNYVILVALNDYVKAVTDSEGNLKRYLFNENVRDYLGENHTNSHIMNTLTSEESPDFWLLNNGITMLTSNATVFDGVITINDVQIVNGLQTTVTIFNYFQNGGKDEQNRNVLIKVIRPNSSEVGREITKATNNQSSIPLYALHANDKIQKDIEDILYRNDYYYERRPMYYKNLGYSEDRIIAPLYLAGGYTALILKLPHRASRLKSKFMDNKALCEKVFSEHADITLWPVIAMILKKTDAVAETYRGIIKMSTEKYLKSVRYSVALVTLARIMGKYSFGVNDLVSMDKNLYSEETIKETIEYLISFIDTSKIKTVSGLSDRSVSNAFLNDAAQYFSIPDFHSINRRPDFNVDGTRREYEMTPEFLLIVKAKLPKQPWPIGIHRTIASELGEPPSKVSQAINKLIEEGVFHKQKDGIVYDKDGNIVAKDETRNTNK